MERDGNEALIALHAVADKHGDYDVSLMCVDHRANPKFTLLTLLTSRRSKGSLKPDHPNSTQACEGERLYKQY